MMDKKWQYKKIGDVCIVERGGSPRPIDQFITDGEEGINWIKIGDTTESMYITETAQKIKPEGMKKSRYVQPGDFLLSNSMSFGRPYILKIDGCIHDGWLVLRDKDELFDKRFLYYYLSSKTTYQKFKGMAVGGVVNNLNSEMVRKVDVPVPLKSEQAEIADLLDKLNFVVVMRQQELQKLDELVKARFVEMFGDPMLNPQRYAIKKYGELFELNAGGTPSKTVPEYWENGTISWIGSNMCQNTILYENDGKYISQAGYDHSSARLFPIDTVLIALVGATIGKTALLKFETSTNQNVLGVRHIAESGYNPLFVYYYTQFLYQKFLNIGDGGFNMASKGFVSELPMYDIDIDKQNQFAYFAERLDKSKVAVQKALDEAQLLFDSLMQQYFG